MTKKTIDKSLLGFTRRAEATKTMMFGLKPDPRSLAFIEKRGLIEDTEERNRNVAAAKNLIDVLYRDAIEEGLACAVDEFDQGLFHEIIAARKAVAEAGSAMERYELARKHEEAVFEAERSVAALVSDAEIVKCKPGELVSKVASTLLRERGDAEGAAYLEELGVQASYFADYKEHRDRAFTASAVAGGGTIARRVIGDNVPTMDANARLLDRALEAYPEVVDEMPGWPADDLVGFFAMDSWTSYFPQSGIDAYNAMIGGYEREDGTRRKGLNQALSEVWDADRSRLRCRPKLGRLDKMILSDKAAWSRRGTLYADDLDMAEDVEDICDLLENVVDVETGKVVGAGPAVLSALAAQRELGFPNLTLGTRKTQAYLADVVFGSASALCEANESCRESLTGPYAPAPGKRRSKKRAAEDSGKKLPPSVLVPGVAVGDVVSIADAAGLPSDWCAIEREVDAQWRRFESAVEAVAPALAACTPETHLQNDLASLHHMREMCNALYALRRLAFMLVPADPSANLYASCEASDGTLLSVLLDEGASMANRVRNRLSRKPYSDDHMLVDFGSPTLGAGWDVNKRFQYGNLLLIHGGRYYYGVVAKGVDPETGKRYKTDKSLFEPVEGGEWRCVSYKVIPDASKALARMFQGKAGAKYGLPDELAFGMAEYIDDEGKKHRRYNEDPAFLRDLIEAVSARITGNGVPAELVPEGWEHFKFTLKDPGEYGSWGEFCRDVDACGSVVWYEGLSDSNIQRAVDSGQLYLFEIRNRDMDSRRKGTKRGQGINVYSRMLDELVSESAPERAMQVLGSTKVFFRPASVKDPVVHKAGSWLVDRTYVEDGVRKTVPDGIRIEIYNHLNGFSRKPLSAEAVEFQKKAHCHKAHHDIVKDARFTRDSYELHIGVSINNTAAGPKDYASIADNDSALVGRAVETDCPILSVARGERTLAYAVLMDRGGEVIGEWDLDVVNGVDYRGKLKALAQVRSEEEKNWQQKTKIAGVREAYIQRLVAWVARKVVETGAVVAIESPDDSFKDKRCAIEYTLWKSFAVALVNKLSCLVADKRLSADEPGSPTNPLQLCAAWSRYMSIGTTTGNIVHVPTHYIVDVDLSCGYVPVVARYFAYKNAEAFDRSLRCLRSLSFRNGSFKASFSYGDFEELGMPYSHCLDTRVWHVTSSCGRKSVKTSSCWVDVDVTVELAALLDKYGVDYSAGRDLRDDICSMLDAKGKSKLAGIIRCWLQVRNGYGPCGPETASPVLNGEIRAGIAAHKARAIALKAELMLSRASLNDKGRWRVERPAVAEWLAYLAEGRG